MSQKELISRITDLHIAEGLKNLRTMDAYHIMPDTQAFKLYKGVFDKYQLDEKVYRTWFKRFQNEHPKELYVIYDSVNIRLNQKLLGK